MIDNRLTDKEVKRIIQWNLTDMQPYYILDLAAKYHRQSGETRHKFRQRIRNYYAVNTDAEVESLLSQDVKKEQTLKPACYRGVSGMEINQALENLYTNIKQLNLKER